MRTSYALLSASFGVVLLLTPPGGAVAQTPCSKPIQPICSTDMQTAATEAEQLRCQAAVRRYQEMLAEYRDFVKGTLDDDEKTLDQSGRMAACLDAERKDCRMETGTCRLPDRQCAV